MNTKRPSVDVLNRHASLSQHLGHEQITRVGSRWIAASRGAIVPIRLPFVLSGGLGGMGPLTDVQSGLTIAIVL